MSESIGVRKEGRQGSRDERDDAGRGAVLHFLEDLLERLQDVAWELADLAEDAADVWSVVESRASTLGDGLVSLGREVSDWPTRISRLASTAWVLGQITTSYRFHEATAGFRTAEGAARALEELHARNGRRFYQAAIRQGGAFLKVGQLFSARMDLLPEPWIAELVQLQDAVPAAPFEAVRPIVEEDLGAPLEALFRSIEEEPVAAASIGQVHRVVTHDGVVAALKVQRPGIRSLIELDLSLFEVALESMQSMFPPADYETIVDEVRTMVLAELDYVNEAQIMTRVADFFEGHPDIVVPRPVPGRIGKRAFASTFVPGRKITDVLDECDRCAQAGDPSAAGRSSRILGLLLECYLRQVLEAGVFQADPHPGNLLVTEADELVLLDFGCTKPMPEATRELYLALMQSFLAGDRDRVAALFLELGFATRSGGPETLHAFADALLRGFEKASEGGDAFPWMSQEEVFEQAGRLLELSWEDPVIRLPAEFVMLGRVFGTLGGLFHHYRPKIDYPKHLFPVLGRAMLDRSQRS